MKKVCFIEMEGVLSKYRVYSPDTKKVIIFLEKLTSFCKKNKIELYIISGHHVKVASEKFKGNKFHNFFDDKHFLSVTEEYILKKADADQKLHREGLEKDKEYNDSYFKQIAIQDILKKMDINEKDALLLGDDLWVDGYYTTRFSKVDFAIFEGNIVDRGKQAERMSGLAYFNLDFDSVSQLLENFPATNNSVLEKHVFDVMSKFLVGDSVRDSIKNAVLKKGFDKS